MAKIHSSGAKKITRRSVGLFTCDAVLCFYHFYQRKKVTLLRQDFFFTLLQSEFLYAICVKAAPPVRIDI